MKKFVLFAISCIVIVSCKKSVSVDIKDLLANSPSIQGKLEYLHSPMVTAGDRVYSVGHQNGSFPELGWHIQDEMGGIWNHPIKLMDGFEILLSRIGTDYPDTYNLNNARSFTNYPFANKFEYHWPSQDIEIERWQFVPDGKEGMNIQVVLHNKGNKKDLEALFAGYTDLRPTWLGERTNMIDTQDMASFNDQLGAWVAKDSLNSWYAIFGSNLKPSNRFNGNGNKAYNGLGVGRDLVYAVHLEANETKVLNFTIAGSYISESNALKNYSSVRDEINKDLIAKKERYQVLAHNTKLTVPDKDIEEAFEWIKYNCDWLVRTVPEIGTGIGAGLPDYPWWFGVDSEYALQGYMAIGQTETVYSTIKLLDSISNSVNNNSGRIIHEMSTNGAVYNKGNVNETPQFASLLWNVYKWTGDQTFLEYYFPTVENGLNWLMNENDANKNLFPDGYGMMEVHGMDSEMIDVAVYSFKGFEDAAKIATAMGKDKLGIGYTYIAEQIKKRINEQFWSEEFESYADFIGDDAQALKLIEGAIVRADTLQKPWAVAELTKTKQTILANPSEENRPFVLHHNWVVNTPMEMGIAPKDRATMALKTAEKFANPYGMFVTGIDRDASAGSDDGSFRGSEQFSYTGAVMTLPTAVQIIAENNYGNPDKALNYLKRMTRSFSYALPGSMYEVSPDYGMMTQAWNVYGYAIPIVEQFFGIQPNAANKKVIIAPQMPSSWNNGALEHVKIGDNTISVYYSKSQNETELRVTQTKDWSIEIRLPGREKKSITVSNNKETVLKAMTTQ